MLKFLPSCRPSKLFFLFTFNFVDKHFFYGFRLSNIFEFTENSKWISTLSLCYGEKLKQCWKRPAKGKIIPWHLITFSFYAPDYTPTSQDACHLCASVPWSQGTRLCGSPSKLPFQNGNSCSWSIPLSSSLPPIIYYFTVTQSPKTLLKEIDRINSNSCINFLGL